MINNIQTLALAWVIVCTSTISYSQSFNTQPAISYQTVIYEENPAGFGVNPDGLPVSNKDILFRFIIREDTETGNPVYEETQEIKTNRFAVANALIGRGITRLGTNITDLEWGKRDYYLEVSIDMYDGKGFRVMAIEALVVPPWAVDDIPTLTLVGSELFISGGNSVLLGDLDETNELIESVELVNGVLQITDASGTYSIDLSNLLSETSTSDEIQDLELIGNTLRITKNSTATDIDLSPFIDNTQLTESEVDAYVSNNGYLTTETDGSTTNEIQDISTDGASGNITISDGSTLNLNVNDADADAGNEIQDLNLNTTTHTLTITGNSAPTNIDLSPYMEGVFATSGNITSNENGDYTTDDFVYGSPQLDDDGDIDHSRKMYFDKSKGAFRAGYVLGNQWDDINVGLQSTAFGYNSTASGIYSFAAGSGSIAYGNLSVAMGLNCESNFNSIALGQTAIASGSFSTAIGNTITASGSNNIAIGTDLLATAHLSTAIGGNCTSTGIASLAMGRETSASANYAIAMGRYSSASGNNSIAIGIGPSAIGVSSLATGNYTSAGSYGETVIGLFNTIDLAADDQFFDSNNRLFVVGNGIGVVSRSDALIMLKNGNTTLHGELTIDADNVGGSNGYSLPGQDGTNGYVLQTDGAGIVSWIDPASLPSDKRLKHNLIPLHNSLQKVGALKGYTFQWNDLLNKDPSRINTGFIAQEVEAIIPELVAEGPDGYKRVNYVEVIPYLVEAIKALKIENSMLENELIDLKASVNSENEKINTLENRLAAIEKILNSSVRLPLYETKK